MSLKSSIVERQDQWIGPLQIRRAFLGTGACLVPESGNQWPIPECTIPRHVTGFYYIQIRYVDQTVIEFLHRIRRLFDSCGTNVDIKTQNYTRRSGEFIWRSIWPLLNDNVRGLRTDSACLTRLREFAPTILHACAALQFVSTDDIYPELPADSGEGATAGQALSKWLLTPRRDGLPKVLHCVSYSGGMEVLEEPFLDDVTPVNFIVSLTSPFAFIEPFELKNTLTKEKLTLLPIRPKQGLLVRCPAERDEEKWAKWEREAVELVWERQHFRISIDFNNRDIYDWMGPAEPGASILKKQ